MPKKIHPEFLSSSLLICENWLQPSITKYSQVFMNPEFSFEYLMFILKSFK